MAGSPQYSFHIFRYQILPVSQQLPLFISDDITSIEDLKSKKNDLFFKALHSINKFIYNRAGLIHKILYNKNEISIFKIGVNRILNREKPDFTEEEVDNWPNMLIIFNNDEKVQKVAIQFRRKAFSDTKTVASLLEENINNLLSKYYLSVHFKPIFTKNYFWDLVDTYQEKIIKAEFDMISPNMSNISNNLNFDLSELHQKTNTKETKLELKCPSNTNLSFDREDKFIDSIVDYSSQGGGNISLKVKGIKRKFQTSNSIEEFEFDEIEIKNASSEEISGIFKNLLR